ncbi:Aconitate hydratase cytoplasmic [Tripterygium wilfordii]|uniref:Aconitate hydratase cytoplasmic n=1 Tax=Tripterygium wilfordii TaxID=458696 RepID=A0A7J7D1Z5_TRIWF|nr:Aconitate hydratase cytoplasmic [Tripterygium wilfordii]
MFELCGLSDNFVVNVPIYLDIEHSAQVDVARSEKVNLECLGQVVLNTNDSDTTMIDGLGVAGWGVVAWKQKLQCLARHQSVRTLGLIQEGVNCIK